MSSSSSVISRVGGYAPGWLADYATVGSALHANFSALGPFSTSDVIVGVTYLWEIERNKRAETGVAEDPGIGPGPSFDELDDLRALCVATEVRSVSNPSSFLCFFLCFFQPSPSFHVRSIIELLSSPSSEHLINVPRSRPRDHAGGVLCGARPSSHTRRSAGPRGFILSAQIAVPRARTLHLPPPRNRRRPLRNPRQGFKDECIRLLYTHSQLTVFTRRRQPRLFRENVYSSTSPCTSIPYLCLHACNPK